jgi:uncharacterized OsmC-like protein
MTYQALATAIQRAEAVLRRRPDVGMQDDSPATARWKGGTRVVSSHPHGTQVTTDMPTELGGSGDQVSPGWLFRAGIASCATTSIVMAAASEGIELTTLEVHVSSRSDTRGLLGMVGPDGAAISSAPNDVQLHVRIAARGVAPDRLRKLVESGCRCSPIPNAVRNAVPLALHVEARDA